MSGRALIYFKPRARAGVLTTATIDPRTPSIIVRAIQFSLLVSPPPVVLMPLPQPTLTFSNQSMLTDVFTPFITLFLSYACSLSPAVHLSYLL